MRPQSQTEHVASHRRILGLSDSASLYAPAWHRPAYMELIVELSAVARPRICYIGAASGEDAGRRADFHELATKVGAQAESLRFFHMVSADVKADFELADIIYIDGGATRNLIALLREWSAIQPLIDAYERGALLVGASAGISMLFDWCVSDSVKTRIAPLQGIGLLKGSVCAHHDSRSDRRDVLKHLVMNETRAKPCYGLDDGTAILFADGRIATTYSLRASGRVHTYERCDDALMHRSQPAENRLDIWPPKVERAADVARLDR